MGGHGKVQDSLRLLRQAAISISDEVDLELPERGELRKYLRRHARVGGAPRQEEQQRCQDLQNRRRSHEAATTGRHYFRTKKGQKLDSLQTFAVRPLRKL